MCATSTCCRPRMPRSIATKIASRCRGRAGRTQPANTALFLFRDLQIALGEFLDVHILERDDPHILNKTGRTVHVPNPGVLHGDLEVHLAVFGGPDIELDLVGQIETALGLHDMAEKTDNVPILAVELELHLGLVLLEILRAHLLPSEQASRAAAATPTVGQPYSSLRSTIGPFCPLPCAMNGLTARSASASGSTWSASWARRAASTFTKLRRCSGQGPCASSARMWLRV